MSREKKGKSELVYMNKSCIYFIQPRSLVAFMSKKDSKFIGTGIHFNIYANALIIWVL